MVVWEICGAVLRSVDLAGQWTVTVEGMPDSLNLLLWSSGPEGVAAPGHVSHSLLFPVSNDLSTLSFSVVVALVALGAVASRLLVRPVSAAAL